MIFLNTILKTLINRKTTNLHTLQFSDRISSASYSGDKFWHIIQQGEGILYDKRQDGQSKECETGHKIECLMKKLERIEYNIY